jgi:hypothetical protein
LDELGNRVKKLPKVRWTPSCYEVSCLERFCEQALRRLGEVEIKEELPLSKRIGIAVGTLVGRDEEGLLQWVIDVRRLLPPFEFEVITRLV